MLMTGEGKEEIKFIHTGHHLEVERGAIGFEPETQGTVVKTYSGTDDIDWWKAKTYRRAMDGIGLETLVRRKSWPEKLRDYR